MSILRSRPYFILFVLLCGLYPVALRAQDANLFDLFRSIFNGAPPKPELDKPKKPHKPRGAVPLKSGQDSLAHQVYGPPLPPRFFVHVFGDSLGNMMAQGLTEALADTSEIAIIKRAKDSAGLVRDSLADAPKTGEDMPPTPEHIDVAVVMIGANDRQPFVKDGKIIAESDTEDWDKLYKAKIEAAIKPFMDKQIPVIWVGLPIMRSENYSNAMYKLNEIDRDVVIAAGASFVDTWDAFSNDRGDYDQNGPDINGQRVRLRMGDGIHFTKAGQRKLASFVERDIRRIFDEHKPLQNLQISPDTPSDVQDGNTLKAAKSPVKKERPISGPVLSLSNPPQSANGELVSTLRTRQPLSKLPVSGSDPHPGRADDFVWPQP